MTDCSVSVKEARGGESVVGALHRNRRVSLYACAVYMYMDAHTCAHAQRREEGIGILPLSLGLIPLRQGLLLNLEPGFFS